MKKIFIGIVLSIMLCLFVKSPSLVKADDRVAVGYAVYNLNDIYEQYVIYCRQEVTGINLLSTLYNQNYSDLFLYIEATNSFITMPIYSNAIGYLEAGYIPTLTNDWNYSGTYIYNDYDEYLNDIPEEFWPEDPSIAEQHWDAFYDWYESVFGYRPLPNSLIDLLRNLVLGDNGADTEIIFPTLPPTPTPTPIPTPIPVQTIFVPDGNGGTTIIYQYEDPDTGVVTQSPYNPNIDIQNNITVDCDCNGNDSNPFSSSPSDPYTLDASLFWADGFGVQMSESPLQVADDSQTSIMAAANEYTGSVNVLSNSFNVLPVKWLTLVGLLGGILIIAGLLKTFLGG